MAKMTLLEMVQDILNDMDSDEVNSIEDTVEAVQVAQIIKTCYFEIIDNRNWPHLKKLVQLESMGNINRPNYLKLPSKMKELILFNYDKRKPGSDKIVLQEVKYKYPEDFLRYTQSRNSENENTQTVVDFSGTKILVLNNAAPQYWTSFDDSNILTDSYDRSTEDTLQASRSQCLAYMSPTWEHTDDSIPDLPEEAFSALLEEAKSTASLALKQMANQKAEQKATRQQRWLSRKAWRTHGGVQYPNYGRKGRR